MDTKPKKRGLTVSGGGAKGAFAIGVVEQLLLADLALEKRSNLAQFSLNLLSTLAQDRLPLDVLAGTSTGALIAAGLAGGTFAHLRRTVDSYLTVSGPGDIIDGPGWGVLGQAHALLTKPGIFSPAPLAHRIARHVNRAEVEASGIALRIAYVDQVSGDLRYATERSKDLLEAVLASACMPGYFAPVAGRFVDGGVREIAPLKPLIDAGCDDITVVLCSPPWPVPVDGERLRTGKDHALRALEIHSNEVVRGDLKAAAQKNDQPGYRDITVRVYFPGVNPIGTLDFNPARMRRAYEIGQAIARTPKTIEQTLAWRP